MHIDINIREIEDVAFLNREELAEAMELIGRAVDKKWSSVWEEKNFYVNPGKKGNVLALVYDFIVNNDTLDAREIGKVISAFLSEEHGEDNILSLQYKKTGDKGRYHSLIYPLNHRVLDATKWVQDGKLNKNSTFRFYKKLKEAFPIEVDMIDDNECAESIEQVKSLAQINLIADLNISKEDLVRDEELIYDAAGLSKQIRTDLSYDHINSIFATTLKYFTVGSERMLFKNAQLGEVKSQRFALEVKEYLKRYHANLTENDVHVIVNKVLIGVYGNYVLEELINDECISDIKVLAPDKIRVKANGKRLTSNARFIDTDDYIRFVEGLAIRNGLDLRERAIHVFTDKYTNSKFIMRFNITTSYINSVPYPYLHIRKIRKEKYSIDDLIRFQMMDRKTADYLIMRAKQGKGILFTGKGASGKTTLMNVLIEEIPMNNSGLIIQESEELFPVRNPDIMSQHVAPEYSLKEEARNGLLTDLDYFIIGEIKGEEALWFLNAAATGHKCWCSVHSASSRDAIGKLADYVMYESKYDKTQAMYMLKELDTIVYLDHFKVTEICEIIGWDVEKEDLVYRTVYKL